MPTPGRLHSRNGITFAEHIRCRRWLPIFVALLGTNLAGLSPATASDTTPLTPVAAITKSMTNHDVTVEAMIASIRAPRSERAPYIVTLTESNASVPLVYWSDMQPQLAPKMKKGNVIRADVTISTYRDNIQLRIKNPDAITLVSAAPEATTNSPAPTEATASPTPPAATATTPPTETVIGKIKDDWANRVVTISGTISGSEAVANGRRLNVQDATGEIAVLIDQKVLSALAVADLQPGRALSVTGPVQLADGKLAVVPETASAVKLVVQ